MKAAVLHAPHHISVEEIVAPSLAAGDVLIRVRAATLCGTDIRIYRGRKTMGVRYPSVLGHEFCGEIVDAGGHPGLARGQRVGVCPIIACGHCPLCASGRENLCPAAEAVGYQIDGAFAELIRIPAAAVRAGNLRVLPDHLSDEQAALAEPLACVLNGQNRVGLGTADTVVVLGAGPIGLIHVHLARHRGAARIIVSDPNLSRRQAALAAGADAVIDARGEDVVESVMAETAGRGADVVICAIGTAAVARLSTQLAAPAGRISLFAGFSKGELAEIDVNAIHYQELVVTGASALSRRDFEASVDMLAAGQLNLSPLVTHRFDLNDFGAALQMAEGREAIKVAIRAA